ncbi:MAG: hypothetical protein HDR81_05955 [Bacteroides sp.]|nr:hypothetical protein [Bacteroides sp.]MBD5362335.1 hypothetical protein [Bacteroides sp.]
MKKVILTLSIALMAHVLFAVNASDSLRTCLSMIQATDATVQTLQRENGALKSEVTFLNSTISVQSNEIDSLKSILVETNNSVAALADSFNINISSTRQQIQTSSDNLNQTIAKKSQTGMWILIVLALIVAAIAFFFGRLLAKRGNEVASLSAKADKLNEEIVNRLSSEMSEMQTISKQIGSISTPTGGGTGSEQKLIATLADRITFMEMTLYKMDSSVRGHKQLSRSIKQMKDNLLANGYELVDMLGKDYHEGMKVTANFVEDENLPEGKQIITGIIKPQINYQGKMIQSAQITVSQNL